MDGSLHSVAALALGGVLALAALAPAAQDEYQPLTVSIAVPVHGKQRKIEVGRADAHFYVILRNVSSRSVSVWLDSCSWGYANLSFLVTDELGKTWVVKKKERGWDENAPDFRTVDPNGDFVIKVTLAPETWESLSLPEPGKSRTVTLQAVFQVQETLQSKERGVWTGKVVSEPKQYTFLR